MAKKGTGLTHKPKNTNLLEVMARNKGAKVCPISNHHLSGIRLLHQSSAALRAIGNL